MPSLGLIRLASLASAARRTVRLTKQSSMVTQQHPEVTVQPGNGPTGRCSLPFSDAKVLDLIPLMVILHGRRDFPPC